MLLLLLENLKKALLIDTWS